MTPPSPLRVAVVSHSANLAGAERSLLELIEELPEHDIVPFVLVPADGPFVSALRDARTAFAITEHLQWCNASEEVAQHPLRLRARIRHHWRALRRATNALAGRRHDVVYTNTIVVPLGGMLSLRLGLPHVWHVREILDPWHFDFGKNASLAFLRATTSHVICNSRATRASIARYVHGDRLRVIYNGPLTDAWQAARPPRSQRSAPIRLCMVGTVSPHKRHGDAIAALAVLSRAGVSAALHIYGQCAPGAQNDLTAQAAQVGVADRVFFHGFLDEPQDAYLENDITLNCCSYEAFGRTVVEAMGSGCPVVAAAGGGVPEIVDDDKTGLLYPPGDVEALARCVKRLIDDPGLRERLAADARQIAWKMYTRERCVREVVGVLREAVSNRKPRHP